MAVVDVATQLVSLQAFFLLASDTRPFSRPGFCTVDGKSCDLVVEVGDIEAHAKVAAASDFFLLYCTCTRRGEPVRGGKR